MKASFSMPTSIRAGVNVVRDNADYFASLGKRALIVSTEAARLCGALDDLSAAFGEKGIEFTLFENCIPNPTTHSMLELAAFARDAAPDLLLETIDAFYLPESPVPIPPDCAVVVDAIDTISAKLHLAQRRAGELHGHGQPPGSHANSHWGYLRNLRLPAVPRNAPRASQARHSGAALRVFAGKGPYSPFARA